MTIKAPPPKSEIVLAIEALLDSAAETSESIDDTAARIADVTNDGEVAIGHAVNGGRFIRRGVVMTQQLVKDAQSGQPPGKIRLAMDVHHFLFGDD